MPYRMTPSVRHRAIEVHYYYYLLLLCFFYIHHTKTCETKKIVALTSLEPEIAKVVLKVT